MKELENAIREIRKPRPYYLDTNKDIADGIEQYVSKEVEDALMEGYERGKSETERKQEQYVISARIEELERQHTNCQVEAWALKLPEHISERIAELKKGLDK